MKKFKNKKFIGIAVVLISLLFFSGVYIYKEYKSNLETLNSVVEQFDTAETREEKLNVYKELEVYEPSSNFMVNDMMNDLIEETKEEMFNSLVTEYNEIYEANLIVEGTNKNDKELDTSIKAYNDLKKQIESEAILNEEEAKEHNERINVEIDKHKVLRYNSTIKALNDKIGKVKTSKDAKTIQGDVDKLKKTIQEDKGLNEESIKNLVVEIDKTIKAAKDKHDALAKSEKEAAEKAEAERLAAEAAAQAAAQATYNNTSNYSNSDGGSSNTQATTRPAAPSTSQEMCTLWTEMPDGSKSYDTKPCVDFWW